MKNSKIMILMAVLLAVICMASVSAADINASNSTFEIDYGALEDIDDYLFEDSANPIDNFSIDKNYGVEGKSVEITPTATANGIEISGNVTFYCDVKFSDEIGTISTEGGAITLPVQNSNESTYCPFYYIFNGEYNGNKYYDKDYLYFHIMKENTIDLDYKFTDEGLTLTVTPTYYKSNGTDSLLNVYINDEEKESFDYGSFSYTLPYNSYDGLLEIYVGYKGYIDELNDEFYASGESKHINAFLSIPTVSVVNSTYDNTQLTVSVPIAGKYTLYVSALSQYNPTPYYLTFDELGEKTVTIYGYPVGKYQAFVKSNGQTSDVLTFNITKAIPAISVVNVGGNYTNITTEHNITLSAPENGKFKTNVTDGEYSSGQSITLDNLEIGENRILITYLGSENYNSTTMVILFVVDKSTSTVSIELNQTKVEAGDKIKITPTVQVGDTYCEDGTVVFYNESDDEIGRIDLSHDNYFEFVVPNVSGAVYAVYLGNSITHQSEKSQYQRYILKTNLNITLEFQSSKAYVVSGNVITLTIETSDFLTDEILELFNGNKSIANISSEKTSYSVNYGSYQLGHNDFYIKFAGNENYTSMESNHLDVLVYKEISVTPIVTANPDYTMEGSEVSVTAKAYYYDGEQIYVNGSVTLYEDYNAQINVTTISIGDTWIYNKTSVEEGSSYSSAIFYYRYDGFIDEENFTVYVNAVNYGRRPSVTITTLADNSMELTVNDENETLDVLKDTNIDLDVALKYYGSIYTSGSYASGIVIYVDDEVYGEFNLTSNRQLKSAQISLSVGNHTVYAYYKGYNSSGNSYASAKSNSVNVNVCEGNIVDFKVETSNSTPKYGETIILTSNVSYNNIEISNGTVQYYIGENPISGGLAIGESFEYVIDTSSEFNITAIYSGYRLYLPKEINITINAQKADNNPILIVNNITYGDNLSISISQAVDGIYTVTIGDYEIFVNVVGGIGSAIAENLDLPVKDGYEVSLDLENDNYTTSAMTTFDVKTAENNVNLVVQNTTYGANLNVSITNAVDGIYTVTIDDYGIIVSVVNGSGINTTEKLDLAVKNNYTATLTFENTNYTTTGSTKFNIAKAKSIVVIQSCEDIVWGNDLNIAFNVINRTDVYYEILDEDTNIISNGSIESNSIHLEGLEIGKYTLTITNYGNENYTSSNSSEIFNVWCVDSDVTIDIDNYAEFNHRNVNISYHAENQTTFEIYIQNSNLRVVFHVETNETFVCPDLEGDSEGELYWIIVYNLGNETVYPSQDMKSFKVFKFDTNVSADIPSNIQSSQAFEINFTLANDTNGNLSVTVDGTQYNLSVVNGSAILSVGGLTYGVKTLNCQYSGDEKYDPANGTLTFTVLTKPKITSNKNIKILYLDGTKYAVRVYGEDGNVASGEYVTFTIGKKTIKVKTDSKGYASFKITYAPKTYKVTATYKTAKVTNKIVVKHVLKSKNKKVKKSAKKLILKASLKKVRGKYLKGKVIKFKFKGKTYKAKTNKKGVAKVTIKKKVLKSLKKAKKYKVKISYNKDVITKKIKVKK